MGEGKKLQIRNSAVDFLVFTKDAEENGIEVRVQDENVWLTQKAIGQLFDIDRSVVTKHLKKIFTYGELDENSVCAFFAQAAGDGKTYRYKFYSLPAIIAVGLPGQLPASHTVPPVGHQGAGDVHEAGVCAGQGPAYQWTDL